MGLLILIKCLLFLLSRRGRSPFLVCIVILLLLFCLVFIHVSVILLCSEFGLLAFRLKGSCEFFLNLLSKSGLNSVNEICLLVTICNMRELVILSKFLERKIKKYYHIKWNLWIGEFLFIFIYQAKFFLLLTSILLWVL